MQITTMLAARQNLAVSVAVAMAVTADTVPGGPNDVGRHPQRNLPRCHVEKVGINTCDTCHQQNDELHMNWKLFLRSGRLRQIVVKDVGILPRRQSMMLMCRSCIVWMCKIVLGQTVQNLAVRREVKERPQENMTRFAIGENHLIQICKSAQLPKYGKVLRILRIQHMSTKQCVQTLFVQDSWPCRTSLQGMHTLRIFVMYFAKLLAKVGKTLGPSLSYSWVQVTISNFWFTKMPAHHDHHDPKPVLRQET